MDTNGTASLSEASTRAGAILNGILIGFFFPLLPYFFFKESKPAVFWDDGTEHEVVDRPIFS